ncbi:flagellar basal-body MS-ring/collar protein FliF [Zavarzinia sp. CC-PAN008]|uniref:flagellar basal-body MS-ring/collar protein FliF n=1 Tax=Zavarzinia sp. CC-PAN008 TaxID=3243332 RepID=UPI003F744EC9
MEAVQQFVKGLGAVRLLAMAGIAAVMIGFFIYVIARVTEPPMALLYAGLDSGDSAKILAELDTLNVPYQLKADGTTIMVPEDQALRLRMQMAGNGLPSGGSMGNEIIDRMDGFQGTEVQRANMLRALEGELARTIRSLDRIAAARVHIVLPTRELFSQERRESTASIMLRTTGVLNEDQIQAISHIVAMAVPGLDPRRISIADQRGIVKPPGQEGENDVAGANAMQQTQAYEDRLRQQIVEMLSRSLGPDRVRAEVTAELNFDKVTETQDKFDPDSQVARSVQERSEQSNSTDSRNNQVTAGNNVPNAQANQAPGTTSNSTSQTSDTVTNYEISRTTLTQVKEVGGVKRLSVAVMVDGTYTTQEDGSRTYAPRSQEELDRIATLVKTAVGFLEDRGDTVEIVNMAFDTPAEELLVDDGTFLGLEKADLFKIGETLTLAVLGLLIILLVLRPMVNRLINPPAPAAAMAAAGMGPDGQKALAGPDGAPLALPNGTPGVPDLANPISEIEAMINMANVEGQVKASSLKKIGEIVQKHPEEAIAIMRNWMYREA